MKADFESELERGPFATAYRDDSKKASQHLLSADAEAETEPIEEEDTICLHDWLTLEWMNNCMPYRTCCVALYDAVRSIPPMSMASIAIAASGYGVTVSNMKLLVSNMAVCDVNLSPYKISMNTFGLCLFLVNGLIVVTSCLLSGWTRESLCRCLDTGIFTGQNGVKTECGIFATIFSSFGMGLLRILMLAGYVMWVACALVLLSVASGYVIVGYLGNWACDLGETHVATLFEVVGRPFKEFRSLNEEKFCILSWTVRSELHNVCIGIGLCLCAQVNFLCIVVHNRRTARLEIRRHTDSAQGALTKTHKRRQVGKALGGAYLSI